MASYRQRDGWTELVRRRAVDLRTSLFERVGQHLERIGLRLSAIRGVVPVRYFVVLQYVATVLAVVSGGLSVAVILVGAFPQWFEGRRLPLHNIRGVVPGQDAVFVGSSTAGRVYKFNLNGELVDWYQFHGRPMSITRKGDAIVISGERQIEEEAFRPGDPGGAAPATVEQTWWGHPILVVSLPEEVVRVELQPWYFTLVQSPWPGMAWWVLLIVFILVTHMACECRRHHAHG